MGPSRPRYAGAPREAEDGLYKYDYAWRWRNRGLRTQILIIAFGVGVWRSAGRKRALRIVGILLVGKEVLGFMGTLFAPIHLRGVERTLTVPWQVWTAPEWRQPFLRPDWEFGSASTFTVTCYGSWRWSSFSYAPKWNGPKKASRGDVILDELYLIARQ